MDGRNDSGSGTRLMTQTFLDASKEAKYRQYHDPIAVYNLLALPIALTSVTAFVLATTQWSQYFFLLPGSAIYFSGSWCLNERECRSIDQLNSFTALSFPRALQGATCTSYS
jgi:hypothetical protein